MSNLYEYLFLLFGFSGLYQVDSRKNFIVDVEILCVIVKFEFITNNFPVLRNKKGILFQDAITYPL